MGCIQSLVAKRPFDMRMNVSLFETKMCLELPILKDEIRELPTLTCIQISCKSKILAWGSLT